MSTITTCRRKAIHKRERIVDKYRIYVGQDGSEKALIGQAQGQGQGQGQGNELCKKSIIMQGF